MTGRRTALIAAAVTVLACVLAWAFLARMYAIPSSSMEPGLRAGDLLVFCKAGWRFSDPGPQSNPIPGNHGHPATEPIPSRSSAGRGVSGKAAS